MEFTGFGLFPRVNSDHGVARASLVTVLGLVSMLGAGCGSGDAPGPESCGDPGLLEATMARWQEFVVPLRGLPPLEKRAYIDSFVATVSVTDLRQVCCQGADRTDPETKRFLSHLTRIELDYDPPPARDLIDLVRDDRLATICRDVAVRMAQERRDDLTVAEGDELSDFLLDRADGAASGQDARRLELWAAQFGTTDRLMSRMRARVTSDEGETRLHGLDMLVESRDLRSTDELVELLRGVVEAPLDPVDEWWKITVEAARKGQSRTLPLLEQLAFRPDYDPNVRTVALISIGWVQDPVSVRLLLRAYEDGGDVRDSTWALPAGEQRDRYHYLHRASRSLGPVLVDGLRWGPPDQALDAYALIVRAVRHGRVVEPGRVTEALQAFAARDLGVDPREIKDTVVRVASPSPPPYEQVNPLPRKTKRQLRASSGKPSEGH